MKQMLFITILSAFFLIGGASVSMACSDHTGKKCEKCMQSEKKMCLECKEGHKVCTKCAEAKKEKPCAKCAESEHNYQKRKRGEIFFNE